VTVFFGSQTGNSQGLAKKLSKKLEELGFQVALGVEGQSRSQRAIARYICQL
jgi:sulfite reductase (NADPH) flavoprotein alpha-component